jgi:hypothetical protein
LSHPFISHQRQSKELAEVCPETNSKPLPPFVQDEKRHEQNEHREITLTQTNSSQADFPFAQTILAVSSASQLPRILESQKPAASSQASSLKSQQKSPQQWLQIIRGHWADIENRNHWRKDACLFEDKIRSKIKISSPISLSSEMHSTKRAWMHGNRLYQSSLFD